MWKMTSAPIASIDYLTAPMALDELRYVSDHSETGEVEAVVGVTLDELARGGYEEFLDTLSERVTGNAAGLSDISYAPVGADDGKVLVRVWGTLEDGAWGDWPDEG